MHCIICARYALRVTTDGMAREGEQQMVGVITTLAACTCALIIIAFALLIIFGEPR
jgi:hypothetical protein